MRDKVHPESGLCRRTCGNCIPFKTWVIIKVDADVCKNVEFNKTTGNLENMKEKSATHRACLITICRALWAEGDQFAELRAIRFLPTPALAGICAY